jgi:hypothetical protein
MSDARSAMARDSNNIESRLALARATAEMGYLREAVQLYTGMTGVWYYDPRVFRERGELLFRLRQFDGALSDLRKAGLLLISRSPILEEGPIGYGSVEDGGGLSTVQYQTFYFQGLTLYGKGDFSAAAPVLLEAVRQAETTADRARALLWLFYSVRRMMEGSQAARVLELARPEWTERADTPELFLIRAFQGQVPTDSVRARALGPDGDSALVFRYGLAYTLLLSPETRKEAEFWLERAHRGPWDAVAHVVAEAELSRLRGPGKTIIR